MLLKLTTDDAQELRRALVAAHRDIVRDLSGLDGCGYSPRGIELCRKKGRLERMLRHLDGSPELRSVPATAHRPARLAVAA